MIFPNDALSNPDHDATSPGEAEEPDLEEPDLEDKLNIASLAPGIARREPVEALPAPAPSDSSGQEPRSSEQTTRYRDSEILITPASNEVIAASELFNDVATSVLFNGKPAFELDLQQLVALALTHSHQIEVQRLGVGIERTQVPQQASQFDWNLFVESAVSNVRQANGSDLASAIDDRPFQGFINGGVAADDNDLIQTSIQSREGLRTLTETGGEVSLNLEQTRQVTDDGMAAADQDVGQFVFRLSHDLLRNAGREVTLNPVVQAQLQVESTYETAFSDISTLVQQVTEAYWDLFFARGEVLVRRGLLEEGVEVHRELSGRSDIDAEARLIARTRAIIEDRRAQLIDANTRLIGAQNNLLRLVNAPELDVDLFEVVPTQPVVESPLVGDLSSELEVAFQRRGEIRSALTRIDAASRQYRVARKQLLPRLAVALESRLFEIDRQPGEGIAAAIQFDYPLGNRNAVAQKRQAMLDLARREAEYRDTIALVEQETRNALNQVNASSRVLGLRTRQITAALEDLSAQEVRRRVAPQAGSIPAFDLDQLLNAQQSVADARLAYLQALRDLNVNLLELLRAKGVLIERRSSL